MKASERDAPKDKVEGGFLLDVVVAEGTAILELLSSEDETLLVRGNTVDKERRELWVVHGTGTRTPPCPGFWP